MKKQLTRSLFGVLAVSPLAFAALGAQAGSSAPRQPLVDAQGAPAPGNVGQAGRLHHDPLGPNMERTSERPPTAAELRAAGLAEAQIRTGRAPATARPPVPLLRMSTTTTRPTAGPLRAATGEPMPGNCMGKCPPKDGKYE